MHLGARRIGSDSRFRAVSEAGRGHRTRPSHIELAIRFIASPMRPQIDVPLLVRGVVAAAVVGCPSMSLAKSTRRIMAPRGEVVFASDGDLAAFDPVNYAAVRRVGDVPTSPAASSDSGPATAWGPLRSGSRCDARFAPSSVHLPPQRRALVT